MKRTHGLGPLGTSLAVIALGLMGFGGTAGAGLPTNTGTGSGAGTGIGTPLPVGWELCILQGVGAPVTPDNVANLDEWQTAEGGSTNNSAAYNPYNTRLMTGAGGAALPVVTSSNGFPAFATWAAGCAATVATLLQSNMTPIVTALQSGTVAPVTSFLLDVDSSQWCAPSNGIPCYASEILSGTATAAAVVADGSGQPQDALTIFSGTSADLSTFHQDLNAVTADQALLGSQEQRLAATDTALSLARAELSVASRALRRLAVDDYTESGTLSSDAGLGLFEAPDDKGIVTQYLRGVATNDLVDRYNRAGRVVEGALARRRDAAAAVAQTTAVLDADLMTENKALTLLDADLQTMEAAGACAAAPATPPATPPTTPPAIPPATPPDGPPATSTVPSTTTTTTPTTPTTPTTTPAPASTTTSTTASTTPTTTTVPAGAAPAGGAAAITGQARAVTLQGCLTAFAPAGSSVSLSAAP